MITIAGGQQGPNILNECYQICLDFNALGYQCFVLNSRPNACPWSAVESGADVARCVRMIRAGAKKYRIDPNRVAVMGMSNGGIAGENCILFFSGSQKMTDYFPEYEPDELDPPPAARMFSSAYTAPGIKEPPSTTPAWNIRPPSMLPAWRTNWGSKTCTKCSWIISV